MEYCKNCGNELKEGVLFCTNCGQKVDEDINVNNQNTSSENVATISIDTERISKVSKSYWSYFMRTLKHPTSSFKEEASYYGIIQLSIMSLLATLSLTTVASNFGATFSMFFRALISFLIWNFGSAGVVYGVTKLFANTKESFMSMTAKYAGLFSSVLLLQAIMFVMGILIPSGVSIFSAILLIVAISLSSLAFTIYIYESSKESKIDRLYILLIAYFIMFIFMTLVSSIIVDSVLAELFNYLEYMF